MSRTSIMRLIEIDMGHRVTFHEGKCRNFHGHRYRIEVTFEGPVQQKGSEQGMVVDFGFMKSLLMKEIDTPCDHALALWVKDPWVKAMADAEKIQQYNDPGVVLSYQALLNDVFDVPCIHPAELYARVYVETVGQVYLLQDMPTAENLARHWFLRLHLGLESQRASLGTRIAKVRVWETPNSFADYEPSNVAPHTSG